MGRRFLTGLILEEIASPSTPSAGQLAMYAKTDGRPYAKDDAGVELSMMNTITIPFHFPGTQTTGVKTPSFVVPVGMKLLGMKGRCFSSTSGCTYRVVQNSATNLATASATGTTVVTTALTATLAVDDYLRIEIVSAGTAAVDLSVTVWGYAT